MWRSGLVAGAVLIVGSTGAMAANSIVVESKTAPPGGSVTIGIYLTNDVNLETVSIPLEVRSVTAGSFIANTSSQAYGGRVQSAFGITNMLADSGRGGSSCYPSPANGANYITPDLFKWESGIGTLSAGTDGSPGSGTPSYTLTVGLTCQDGTFIIDTSCYNSNSVFFDPTPGNPFKPSFTSGTITISADAQACTCNDDPADVNCDGTYDILDVSIVTGVAFRGNPAPPGCCNAAAGTAAFRPISPR